MDRDRDGGPDLEATKLFFEFYKHFTTLSTAVALIVLALFRELNLATGSAIVGISTLGISLLLSSIGMFITIAKTESPNVFGVRPGQWSVFLALAILSMFFTAIIAFLSLAPGLPK